MIWRETLLSVVIVAGLLLVVQWLDYGWFGWEYHGHRLETFCTVLVLFAVSTFVMKVVAKLSALEKELSGLKKELSALRSSLSPVKPRRAEASAII
jgi:Flp pilus assembly pilin Flp